jgi:hypothetical protein
MNKVRDTDDQNNRRTKTKIAFKKGRKRLQSLCSIACIAVSIYLLSLVLFFNQLILNTDTVCIQSVR